MDRINLLEARVREMIGLVQTLREENARLREGLARAEERIIGLTREHAVLDQERHTVRDRIEQLLGDLEGAGAEGMPPLLPERRTARPAEPVLPGLG